MLDNNVFLNEIKDTNSDQSDKYIDAIIDEIFKDKAIENKDEFVKYLRNESEQLPDNRCIDYTEGIRNGINDARDSLNEMISQVTDSDIKEYAHKVKLHARHYIWRRINSNLKIDMDVINIVAGSGYEKREVVNASISFYLQGEDTDISETTLYKFDGPQICIEDARALRKLIETTYMDMKSMLCHERQLTAPQFMVLEAEIGTNQCWIKGLRVLESDVAKEEYLKDRFFLHINNGSWSLYRGRDCLCRFSRGIPEICISSSKEKLDNECENLPITNDAKRIIKAAYEKCSHGALIVCFREDSMAMEESKRLSELGRGYSLENPMPISEMHLERIASVDGAVFIDANGVCYGWGMILDGKASKGNPARGSRYNSAVTYVESCGSNVTAIVVSEDETVDVINSRGS